MLDLESSPYETLAHKPRNTRQEIKMMKSSILTMLFVGMATLAVWGQVSTPNLGP